MPLALELWKNDKAEYWLDRIHSARDNPACVFFQAQLGSQTQGRCAIYPFRPLICRLFGFFTIVNKHGKHVYGSCRVIKLRYPEVYEKALLMLEEIGRASVCTDYSIRIIGIDSMPGGRMLHINLAASIALFADLAQAARLRAKVYIVQAKVPNKLTEAGLIRFARSRNTRRLRETNEPKLKDRSWKAHLVIAFNQPPGDLEFQVLFYDIHDGPRRLVEDLSTFVNDRSQKTYLQKFKLERPRFKPNRNMELVVVVRRQEVARMKFGVIGQEYRRSGTVTFSDDEAKLK